MRGTFGSGLDKVSHAVGTGPLTGTVEVDQVYSHFQHDPMNDLHHPDGGGPNFLTNPLYQDSDDRMVSLAKSLITEDGSDFESGMADAMEALSQRVYERAPWEFGDLRNSGHPVVTSDGEIVYDRAPIVGRLSPEQLKQKSRLSYKYDPDRYSTTGRKRHASHKSHTVHAQTRARRRGEGL